jgi:hypothetical protein
MHGSSMRSSGAEPLSAVAPSAPAAVEPLGALRQRLAKAEADREIWRHAGKQEKYLTAYCLAEALDLQLERRLSGAASPPRA